MTRRPTRPLRDCAQIIRGVSFDKSQVYDAPAPNLIPILRAGNIQDSLLTESDLVFVPAALVSPEQRMRRGDLAVCMSSGSPAIVGKSAHLEADWDGSVGAFCAIVRFNAKLHHRFGSYWFRGPAFLQWRDSNAKGANIQNLRRSELETISIPVPPLAEQERIVKLLDEADQLRKLRAQADRRTAVLVAALFHDMFGRHITSPPVLMSRDRIAAPKGWRWSRLTDVARLATGHTPSRRVPEYWNGDIPWISLTDIRALDGAVAETTSQSVTERGIENSSAVKLPKGTVCFSRTASVGFVTVMGREMCTSQDFVNWVCGDELDPMYLMGALMQAREHLRSLASGSTHKTIYFPTVEQFCIVVPPLPLQRRFAKRMIEIRELEAGQAASRRRADEFFQSLLHRAFEGEL